MGYYICVFRFNAQLFLVLTYLELQQKNLANTIDFSERCFLQMKKLLVQYRKSMWKPMKAQHFFRRQKKCQAKVRVAFLAQTHILQLLRKIYSMYCKRQNKIQIGIEVFLPQGRKWRLGRVGNCPPRFWQNRRRCRELAAARTPHYVLLAHPDLGSYLRPCLK